MRGVSIFATALIAVSATAASASERTEHFVSGADTFVYSVSDNADGSRVLEGERLPAHEPFHFVVAHGEVSGWSGRTPVRFAATDAYGASRIRAR